MNKNYKIIVSLAKIGQENTKELKYVASIVQYPYAINIEAINKTSQILYKHTNFFNKSKFLVINLDFNLDTIDSITPKKFINDDLIIGRCNIFGFFHTLFLDKRV